MHADRTKARNGADSFAQASFSKVEVIFGGVDESQACRCPDGRIFFGEACEPVFGEGMR